MGVFVRCPSRTDDGCCTRHSSSSCSVKSGFADTASTGLFSVGRFCLGAGGWLGSPTANALPSGERKLCPRPAAYSLVFGRTPRRLPKTLAAGIQTFAEDVSFNCKLTLVTPVGVPTTAENYLVGHEAGSRKGARLCFLFFCFFIVWLVDLHLAHTSASFRAPCLAEGNCTRTNLSDPRPLPVVPLTFGLCDVIIAVGLL